jgi:hypothetical protein
MEEPVTKSATDLKWSNPNNVGSVYANIAAVAMTTWDVRILLSEITQIVIGEPPSVILRANIVMTPSHAKAFAKLLEDNIAAYEKQFGKITSSVSTEPPQK